MGRNAPGSNKKADEGKGKDEDSANKKHDIAGALHTNKPNSKSASIMFRSMFETYLQLRYDFYKKVPVLSQDSSDTVKVAGTAFSQ
jgi:hypothetical protein